jgi:hypothetical protein
VLELALVLALAGTPDDAYEATTTGDYAFANARTQDIGSGMTKVTAEAQLPTPRFGYFPLVVHVDNLLGPKQTLKLTFTSSGGGAGGHSYTRSVELDAREARSIIVPVPSHLRYGVLSARGPGITQGGSASLYFNAVNARQRGVLNIGSAESFTKATAVEPSYAGTSAATQVVNLAASEAPSELLPYLGWDAVVVSGARFEELSQAQRQALESYAALGGQLVVMQGARGLTASFPLLEADSPGYGLGKVVFCDKCGYPKVLDNELKIPLRAIEPKGRRNRYAYYDDEGTPELSLPVAQAPIGRFLIIIGLFTLAIGPGSLWIARRKGPSALLVTIPGTAAFTCALIIGYSALRDGFTVHATMQGFTLLDSKNHRALSASVGAFYANLAPGGARFDSGVAVVAPSSSRDYSNIEQAASMSFDDGVKLGADFIPSRSYIEWSFLSVQPTRARLVVKEQGGLVRVQNALGGPLESAHVFAQGKVYRVDALKDGEEKVAEPSSASPSVESWLVRQRVSNDAYAVLDAPLREGEFSAVMDGAGFTPLGGLKLELAESHHLVRGRYER